MMDSPELYRFILKNAVLLEKADAVLRAMDERIMQAVGQYVKNNYVRPGLFDEIDLYDKEEYIGFWKDAWSWGDTNKDWGVLFEFSGEGEGFETTRYWSTILTGEIARVQPGFYFYLDEGWMKGKITPWQQIIKNAFNQYKLADDGFQLNADSTAIVYPLRFSVQDLIALITASDVRSFSTADPCFADIKKAMDAIVRRIAVFDKLAEEAKALKGI